jgi:hypothetical protein
MASLVMFTQLSLFDLSTHFDSVSPVASSVPQAGLMKTEPTALAAGDFEATNAGVRPEASAHGSRNQTFSAAVPSAVRVYGEAKPNDSIQPMGDLARLVIARYEMVARRREEMMRRRVEQPRKSIRVLSPTS